MTKGMTLPYLLQTALLLCVMLTPHGWAQSGANTQPTPSATTQTDALPYQLAADVVGYNGQNELTATGNVTITNGTETLKADAISYNEQTDTVTAKGNVRYQGQSSQTLVLDELTLQGDLKAGALQELVLQDPLLGDILSAQGGELAGGVYTIRNGTYSPCPYCNTEETRKAWRVHADTVRVNPASNTVTYRNAWLDVYGMPIFYTPYLQHPLRDDVPMNGLLPPKFGRSTNLGDELEVGYYHYQPASNTGYTLRARGMSSRGLMGIVEREQEGIVTGSDVTLSLIQDDRRDALRSHLDGNFEYRLQAGRRFGINAQVASDDTYLQDFFLASENYLPSTLYAEDASRNHYAGIYGTFYQDLATERDPANTAHQLPHVVYERLWQLNNVGTQALLNVDGLVLHRSQGDRSRRLITQGTLIHPWQLGGGHLVTLRAEGRGDFYHIDPDAENTTSIVRTFGQLSALWERPLISRSGTHIITPKVMAIYAPRGGNPEEITNEDSVAYELEHTNLFSTNRFAGFDRLENGPRLTYGLDNYWGSPGQPSWRFFFGQTWRRFNDDALPVGAGTSTKLSDFVGFAEADPATWLNFASSFRLDNADFNARRVDTRLRLGYREEDQAMLRITHSMLDTGPEELKLEARLPINQYWRLTAETQRDIANGGRQLYGEVALSYLHSCYDITFTARRRGFTVGDLKPSTDYLVNVKLLTLGRDGVTR